MGPLPRIWSWALRVNASARALLVRVAPSGMSSTSLLAVASSSSSAAASAASSSSSFVSSSSPSVAASAASSSLAATPVCAPPRARHDAVRARTHTHPRKPAAVVDGVVCCSARAKNKSASIGARAPGALGSTLFPLRRAWRPPPMRRFCNASAMRHRSRSSSSSSTSSKLTFLTSLLFASACCAARSSRKQPKQPRKQTTNQTNNQTTKQQNHCTTTNLKLVVGRLLRKRFSGGRQTDGRTDGRTDDTLTRDSAPSLASVSA